ncbi:MAG: hypothetical protein PVJ38_00230 [Candidatus Bathyarchaeota archaeon]
MKTSKLVGVMALLVQIGSAVAFVLSIMTVYGVLTSALGGGMMFQMEVDQTTGAGTLALELQPSNPGVLDADFSFGLSLLDSEGEPVASDSGSLSLTAGGSGTLNLVLEVPREDFERIYNEGESSLEISVSLRTLYDLVGISDTFTIPQGGQR